MRPKLCCWGGEPDTTPCTFGELWLPMGMAELEADPEPSPLPTALEPAAFSSRSSEAWASRYPMRTSCILGTIVISVLWLMKSFSSAIY